MRVSDSKQLDMALEAFASAHSLDADWAHKKMNILYNMGVESINDLGIILNPAYLSRISKKEQSDAEHHIDLLLHNFLPGPTGMRCFRLAQMAAEKVATGDAVTTYVHRPESGKQGDETWHVTLNEEWMLHVDCAGFVRNTLKHVTMDPFIMSLSDRDFMRAKDFFTFFQSVPYTVRDSTVLTPDEELNLQWRIVPDLRMVIPGDIIVYRPRGNAAGGAAFTSNDRSDMKHLLRAVKTSELWHQEQENQSESGGLVTKNMAKDPRVKPWVETGLKKLATIGVVRVNELRSKLAVINELLQEKGEEPFSPYVLELMKECSETSAVNTGHIVFAAGRAVPKEGNVYRIRVVHSTKYGKTVSGETTQGVQEHYRRFELKDDGTWTRQVKTEPPDALSDDDDDDPQDDMDEDPELEDDNEIGSSEPEMEDELAGQLDVDVLAARMCF